MKFALAVVSAALAAVVMSAQPLPSHWTAFRREHPYHVQAIALSEPDRQGWRTLIIAEPPPGTTLQSLARVDAVLRDGVIRQHSLGTDGWIKDVVYRIPPLEDDRRASLVDRVSLELFATSYKAHALSISDNRPAPGRAALDLQISATQLQDWTTSVSETFHPLGRGSASGLQQLLTRGTPGVFYSTTPGLVAWIVPRRGYLSSYKRDIRQFALDSDLVVGAVSGSTHVAILARERQVPIEALPPLRTETILQLASVSEDELAQSYERTDYGAGKLDDNRDWAPIYLSDELIDTEYGSLLNITDQLLKSWTNVGRTTYEGFTYPTPPTWPFKAPLGDLLRARSLTYNWNTKGAGYALATDRSRVFALNRTGALPVSYMPEGIPLSDAPDTARYEDMAYGFFAADTGDPNLARVVQYAALYQVFRHFTTAPAPTAPPRIDHPEMTALTTFVQRALQAAAGADDDGLRSIAAANGYPRLPVTALEKVKAARDALRNYGGVSLDPGFRVLARETANPRASEDAGPSGRLDALTGLQMRLVRRALDPVTPLIISSDGALDAYRRDSRRNPAGWIRTPSYVISTSRRPEEVTGGHNLDARVTVFETSPSVRQGTVMVKSNARGERVVTLNPLDANHVGRAVRTAGREEPSQLKASLESLIRTPAPKALPRNAALGLPPQLGPATAEMNRGLVPAQLAPSAHRGGWALSGSTAPAEYRATSNALNVFVDRNTDYTFRVTLPGSDATYAAASYDAAVDLVAQALPGQTAAARPLTVYFSDVDRADAANFLRSLEVRSNVSRSSRPPRGFGRSQQGSFGTLRESLGRSYDFNSAKVTESVVERVPTGGERLRVSVEVPPIEATKPPLLVRIRIFFAERVSEPIRRSVEQIVTRVLGRATGVRAAAPMSGADIAAAIRADLRALHPDVNLAVGIDLGVGDFFVADASIDAIARGRS